MATRKKNIIFEDVLKDLLQWFKNSPGEFLIIGGVAVSLLTRRRRIKKWVKEFSDALENPDILLDLKKLMKI